MASELQTLQTVYSGRFSPMEVLSDYGTLSNGSCDEDGSCHSSGEEQEFSIGVCPKCRRLFQFPVSLQCGHSLCRACSQLLLDKTGRSGRSSHSSGHRPRVRMGLSSYSSLDVRTSVNVRNQLYSKDILSPMYLSPACPVCHEPPKTVPPVPNYALQNLIDSLMIRNNMMSVQSGFKSNCPIPRNMRNPNSIKEVTIGIVGGSRVGKTQLRHCQLLNGVFFPSSNRSASQYMINLVENPCVDAVDGLVLVYDIAKEKSFDQLVEIERNLTLKENIPIILVGNKADRKKKRQVDSHVAQSFARQVGCPFREVSARCNDGVSESFGDLLHLLDVRV